MPAIIDFYADWCSPCRIAYPILETISIEYSGRLVIYKVDIQVERELAAIFEVKNIPAFLYAPLKGRPVMMLKIARTKAETMTMIKNNIERYFMIK